MKLVAIASVTDGNDIIGARLLDVDTGEIKDVDSASIRNVMRGGKVQIKNIELMLKGGLGFRGTHFSSPKILYGNICGTNQLTILTQVGNVLYRVCDCTGKIQLAKAEDIWEYTNHQGVTNALISRKNGRIAINPVSDRYDVEYIEDTSNNDDSKIRLNKDTGLYSGEFIKEMPQLLPVMVGEPYRQSRTRILSFDGSKCVEEVRDDYYPDIMRQDIVKNGLYETVNYTLYGKVTRFLETSIDRHLPDIIDCLQRTNLMSGIDNDIDSTKARRDSKAKVKVPKTDLETGIYLPIKSIPYGKLIVDENIEGQCLEYRTEIIEKYLKLLDVMQCGVYSRLVCGNRKLALCRRVTSKGIVYRTVDLTGGYANLGTEDLERIYENHTEYDNVIVEGKIMQIRGLDGVYRYDMDKIYSTYNKVLVQSNRALKAAVLNSEYEEVIDARGHLSRYKNEAVDLVMPQTVTSLGRSSITILRNNQSIQFGPNIKESSARCIANSGQNLKYIKIGCNKDAGLSIIKSLISTYAFSRYGAVAIDVRLEFDRDISSEEYFELIYSNSSVYIIANNMVNGYELSNVSDEYILGIIKYGIKRKLNNLKVLKNPLGYTQSISGYIVSEEYTKFKSDFGLLLGLWVEKLKGYASEDLSSKILKMFGDIQIMMDKRVKEVEEESGFELRLY